MLELMYWRLRISSISHRSPTMFPTSSELPQKDSSLINFYSRHNRLNWLTPHPKRFVDALPMGTFLVLTICDPRMPICLIPMHLRDCDSSHSSGWRRISPTGRANLLISEKESLSESIAAPMCRASFVALRVLPLDLMDHSCVCM